MCCTHILVLEFQNVLAGVVKRPSTEDLNEANRKRLALGNGSTPTVAVPTGAEGTSPPQSTVEPGSTKPIDRQHADAVINFLLRLACQVCSVSTFHGRIFPSIFHCSLHLL